MENCVAYVESEFAGVGVICGGCGTEVIFDLDSENKVRPLISCPTCDEALLTAQQTSEGFAYTFVTLYQMARNAEKPSPLRLYFRKLDDEEQTNLG